MQAPSLRCPRVKPALERERRANTASARRVGIAACTLRAGSRAACEAHAPGRPRSAADTREELAADACLRAGEDREAQAPEQRDAPILLPADAPARQRHGLEDLRRTPRQLRRQSAGGARRRWEETLGSEALTIRMMWCFGGFAPRLGRMVRAGTGASASHNSHVQWCPRFQRLRGARRRLLQWAERSSVLHLRVLPHCDAAPCPPSHFTCVVGTQTSAHFICGRDLLVRSSCRAVVRQRVPLEQLQSFQFSAATRSCSSRPKRPWPACADGSAAG